MRVFTEQRIDSLHVFADFTNQYIFFINSKQALPVIFFINGVFTFQDPAYSTGKFGEVRELILGMLETYNYEQVNYTAIK